MRVDPVDTVKLRITWKDKFYIDLVFRRADKNDDGALSWEEFKTHFADGVLTEEEMKELFVLIDTDNTNNIDTQELCTYFTQHLGSFRDIFAAVEDLNASISKALQASAEEYTKSSLFDKFTTRFLLREIVSQISALQRPLDIASDHLDEQAQVERQHKVPVSSRQLELKKPALEFDGEGPDAYVPGSVVPGRFVRRAKRQMSNQSAYGDQAGAGPLSQQLERLQSLVDKLENKVTFDPVEEEEVTYGQEELHSIVHRKFVCTSAGDKAFRNSLRNYVDNTGKAQGCLHVNVRSYPGSNLYVVYEIWETDADYKRQHRSEHNKKFQHSNVDNLEIPEQLRTMMVPQSWWNRN